MGLGSPAGSVDEAPAIQAGDLILAPQCSHQNWALMANRIQPRVGDVETSKSLGLSLPKSFSSRFNERVCLRKIIIRWSVNEEVPCCWSCLHTHTHTCAWTTPHMNMYTQKRFRKKGSVVTGGGNYDRFCNIWKKWPPCMKEAEILRCKLIQNIGGNVVQASYKRTYSGPSYPWWECLKDFQRRKGLGQNFWMCSWYDGFMI